MLGKIFFDFGDVILEFFLAWLIAFILSPIVRWIIEHVPRLPRVVAVVIVYLLLFTGMVAVIVFIAQTLATAISEFIDYLPEAVVRPAPDPRPAPVVAQPVRLRPDRPRRHGRAGPGLHPRVGVGARRAAPVDRGGQRRGDRDDPDRGHPVGLHPGRPGADPGVHQPARAARPARRRPAPRAGGLALVRWLPARAGGDRVRLRRDRPARRARSSGLDFIAVTTAAVGAAHGDPVLRAVRVVGAAGHRGRVHRPGPDPADPGDHDDRLVRGDEHPPAAADGRAPSGSTRSSSSPRSSSARRSPGSPGRSSGSRSRPSCRRCSSTTSRSSARTGP